MIAACTPQRFMWLAVIYAISVWVIYQSISYHQHHQNVFPREMYRKGARKYESSCSLPRRFHLAQASNYFSYSNRTRAILNNTNEERPLFVSMTLSFHLPSNCRPRDHAQEQTLMLPVVRYGMKEGTSTKNQTLIVFQHPIQFNYTSTIENDVSSPSLFTSDWIYHVELPAVEAGLKEYWYSVEIVSHGPDTTGETYLSRSNSKKESNVEDHLRYLIEQNKLVSTGQSETYSFFSPPKPGQPTTMALVGDVGQTFHSLQTMYSIFKASSPDPSQQVVSQLIIAGDLSYADSDPHRWSSWLDWMEPALRSVPLHTAAGNHEIECTTHGDIFVPYEHYFKMPNRVAPPKTKPVPESYRKTLWKHSCSTPSEFVGEYDYGNSFYSFEHGLSKVIVLNSYTNTSKGSPQYNWLLQELKNRTNRTWFPWLLVVFHAPLQTTFLGHVDEIESRQMKEAMEDLFIQYRVNLIISGHDHAYMRTYPMVHGKRDPTGPIYLTLGAGGNREGHPWGYRQFHPEEWVAKRDMTEYGYGHFHIANKTHALFRWMYDNDKTAGFRDIVWFENQLYLA